MHFLGIIGCHNRFFPYYLRIAKIIPLGVLNYLVLVFNYGINNSTMVTSMINNRKLYKLSSFIFKIALFSKGDNMQNTVQVETVTVVNPTFNLIANKRDDETPVYKEYRWRWENYPKQRILGKFPIHVDLESTARCNLECIMCFQSDHAKGGWREQFAEVYKQHADANKDTKFIGDMEFTLFKKVIDEGRSDDLVFFENGRIIDDRLRSIKLQYHGEPLMSPHLAKMVKYAKEKGVVEVMFNTNGVLLTEDLAIQLIEAGLDKIIFSVDGASADIYENIRQGPKGPIKGLFDRVVKNIKFLRDERDRRGLLKPIIRVQAVYQAKNKHEMDNGTYEKFWGPYADHIANEDENDYHETNKPISKASTFCCDQLWQRLFVNYNGDMTLCCGDVYKRQIIGNAYKDRIQDIWQNAKLTHFRNLHLKGESHKMIPCTTCGYRDTIIQKHHPESWKEYIESPEYKEYVKERISITT